MYKVRYEECKSIWDKKRIKDLIGEYNHFTYACKKLNVKPSLHPEIRLYYKKYFNEKER